MASESNAAKIKRRAALIKGTQVFSRLCIHAAMIVAAILIFSFCLHKAYTFGYSIFTTGTVTEGKGTDIEVTIKKGMTEKDVGELLQKEGVIKDANVFYVQAKIYGYEIQPGTYTLNTSEEIQKMLEIMSVVPETKENAKEPPASEGAGN